MPRRGPRLTYLSRRHVTSMSPLLPKEQRDLFDNMRTAALAEDGVGLAIADKQAWMAVRARYPDLCERIEVEYFRKFKRSLKVGEGMQLVPLNREDVVKHEAESRKLSQEEAAHLARAIGADENPPPSAIYGTDGNRVDELVDDVPWPENPHVNFRQTVAWVAENLYQKRVNPKSVPNGTAWGLLRWARRNEAAFYQHLFKALVPPQGKLIRDEERMTSESVTFEDADEMLVKSMSAPTDVDDIAATVELDEGELGSEWGDAA